MRLLTTVEVGERLSITPQRIGQLIRAGRLRATRIGRDWLINEADLASFTLGVPGWPKGKPRKPATAKTA